MAMASERRQAPRIEILTELQGHTITLDEPVTVREVSDGGLTLETRYRLQPESRHEFRLRQDDQHVVVAGRVVHWRGELVQGEIRYISGIQLEALSDVARDLLTGMAAAPQPARRR